MAFSNSMCLHMFSLLRSTMKLGKNTPRVRNSILNFSNKATFLIGFHRASYKHHITDRVRTLIGSARIDVFAMVGAVGIN